MTVPPASSASGSRPLLLITGGAGRIGTAVRPLLRDRYRLRLVTHSKPAEPAADDELVQADIQDLPRMLEVTAGAHAVLHLAANASMRTPWNVVRDANIDGTFNVFEAARLAGVRKLVFASTNHVTGMYERDGLPVAPEMVVRPDSLYGVSKAFGEALGRFYVDEYGMSVICVRIGSFQPHPRNPRMLATWLSPRDFAQLVWRGIESDVPFGVFYGISGNTRRYWDISNAQSLLGYAPEDDAEEFAAELLATPS